MLTDFHGDEAKINIFFEKKKSKWPTQKIENFNSPNSQNFDDYPGLQQKSKCA